MLSGVQLESAWAVALFPRGVTSVKMSGLDDVSSDLDQNYPVLLLPFEREPEIGCLLQQWLRF